MTLFTTGPDTWPKRYHMMGLLLLALLLCYIDRVLISLAAIEMQRELGWSNSQKGLIFSIFFMGYLIMQVAGGILANRFSGRNVFMIAVILWSVFTLLTPAAAYISFAVLLAARFLLGMGEGAAYPSAYSLIHEWMPLKERSRATSMIMAAAAIGTILALLVTGILIERFGWQSVFYLFGSIGLFWAIFWAKNIPGTPIFPESKIDASPAPRIEKKPIPWKIILSHPAVLALYATCICAGSISYTLASWLPSYFVDSFGLTLSQAGFYTMIPWIIFTIATLLAGVYADKILSRGIAAIIVRKRLMRVSLIITIASLLAVTYVGTPIVAVLVICGIFAGTGIMTPAYVPISAEVLPDHGEILYGFAAGMASIGSSVVVAITGVLLEKTNSYDMMFYLMAMLSVIALTIFQLFGRASPIYETSDPLPSSTESAT